MTFNARSFPSALLSVHAEGTRCPAVARGTIFALRGIALAALFSARTAAGADLTVDGGNSHTVNADATYDNIYVGETGYGSMYQSAYNVTVNTQMVLGDQSGSNGYYGLSGSGQLNVTTLQVGRFGTGLFVQNGGVATVSDELSIGNAFTTATGTYSLQAGTLVAKHIGRVTANGDGPFRRIGL